MNCKHFIRDLRWRGCRVGIDSRRMSWVLFFDGDCAFCSASVRRVAWIDKRARISFAPLQGELARKMGLSHHAEAENGTMVLLREPDEVVFTMSDGLVELSRALGGGWRIFSLARFIPKRLRDGIYRWIARHRFHFMGKTNACMLPDPELLKRLRN